MAGLILPGDEGFNPPESGAARDAGGGPLWEPALRIDKAGSFAMARDAGFRAIEVVPRPGALAGPRLEGGVDSRTAASEGVEIASLGVEAILASHARERRRAGCSLCRDALRLAEEIGARSLSIRARVDEPHDRAEGWRYLLDALHDVMAHRESLVGREGAGGTRLCVEAGVSAADALYEPEAVARVLAEAPSGIGLTLRSDWWSVYPDGGSIPSASVALLRLAATLGGDGALELADPKALERAVATCRRTGEDAPARLVIHAPARSAVDGASLAAVGEQVVRALIAG